MKKEQIKWRIKITLFFIIIIIAMLFGYEFNKYLHILLSCIYVWLLYYNIKLIDKL